MTTDRDEQFYAYRIIVLYQKEILDAIVCTQFDSLYHSVDLKEVQLGFFYSTCNMYSLFFIIQSEDSKNLQLVCKSSNASHDRVSNFCEKRPIYVISKPTFIIIKRSNIEIFLPVYRQILEFCEIFHLV